MARLRNPQRTYDVIAYLRKQVGLAPLPAGLLPSDKNRDEILPRSLEQRPASFTFLIKNGKIEAEPQLGVPQDSTLARDIYEQVKDKISEAHSRFENANVPRRVLSSLERLSGALGETLGQLKPGLLLMRFRSLEADIGSYNTPAGQEELFPDAISLLKDLSASLEDLMACFPKLAEIEAARIALRLQEADVAAAREQMAGIREAAANSDVVAASALRALDVGAPELAHTTEIIENQIDDSVVANAIRKRSSIVAQMLLDYRNFAARVLYKMAADVSDAGARSWDEAIKAVPEGRRKGR